MNEWGPGLRRGNRGRVTDLTSMKLLLTEGVGWGYMPEPLVNKDIERGQLVVLSGHLQRSCVLHAIYRKDTPLGPAASFFLSRLVSQASSEVYRGPAECGVSRLAGKA